LRDSGLPEDVVRFVHDWVDRIETLEVLVLLHSDPSREWTIPELSTHMRSSALASRIAIDRLVAMGAVAERPNGYAFHPKTADLDQHLSNLVACYREKRTAVVAAIFNRPSDAVRSFAEAFRIKKDDSNG
jgi:hypothetical protein